MLIKLTKERVEKEFEVALKYFEELGIEEIKKKEIVFEIEEGSKYIGNCENYAINKNKFKITLRKTIDERYLIETIVHEMIHCLKGCFNHKKKFQDYCLLFNEKFKMDLGTSSSKYEMLDTKYRITCDCGALTHSNNKTDLIKNPQIYECIYCKTGLRKDMIEVLK